MKIKTALTALCVLALVVVFQLPAAFSQDDIVQLKDDAFGSGKRPAATFVHDAHNEKAQLEDDCNVCHHAAENGVRVADGDSIGTPCADCHAVKGGQGTVLKLAYHKQCKGCHEARGGGPMACGQCHQKPAM